MTTEGKGEGTNVQTDGTPQGDPKVEDKIVTPDPKAVEADAGKSPPAKAEGADPFADLDEDTREWLKKRDVKDLTAAAKLAREQSKLLGNAVRIPGKDAAPEEVAEFLNKLGRPEAPDGYEFTPPADLPEDLPYDAERASEFKKVAHELGLTAKQAQAVHDWAVKNAVGDFNSSQEQVAARNAEIAKGETEKLIKRWGPLKGETAQVNLTYADKALVEAGGEAAVAEFKRVGLIGGEGDKVVMSEPIAVMLSNIGRALYKEDSLLRGNPDRLNNPFSDETLNVTAQMRLVKEDKATAISYITAAGKKPEDFGLKA